MIKIAHVIDAVITLRDQISGTLRNVNGNLSEFQRQATYAGRNMISVGKDMEKVGKTLSMTVTVPIVAAGAALLKLGQDFETAENTIRTTTGATGKDLEDLDASFKKVYGQVPASMADASTAVSNLHTQLGITGKPLEDLSDQMLNLSRITKTDLSTDITAATRMFQDAGIKQEDYSKALDYTYKVTQNTGIGIDTLQQLMTQFGGPLRQMGFDWQTSAAMLGQFQKSGVNTELVVGSLRIALGKMSTKGIKDPAAALQDMITKIKAAGSAGEANAMALSMFGAKAGPDMAASIREGHMDLSGLLKILKDSPDTINKAAADTMTFSDKMSLMKQQMAVAFEPVGTKLLDSLDKLMPAIQNVADTVAGFAKKLADMTPEQQEMIMKFALMAAAAGPVILMLGKVVKGVGDTVKTFTDLSRSVSAAGGILKYLATPGGIVIVVITAIALAALILIKYWGPISGFFKKIWEDISGPINDVKEKFQEFLDKIKEIKDKLIDLKDKAVKDVKKIFEDFTQTLKDHKDTIKDTADVLLVIFGPALIKTGVKAVISGGQILGSFVANIIKTGAEAVISATKLTASFIFSLISSGAQAVIAGGKITISFIASLLKTSAQAVITGGAITLNLIGSLIAYAAQGWKTVAAISAQTLSWLAQKGIIFISTAVTWAMTAAQWALNAAMDANPIALIILGMAGLIAIGVLLYQNWDMVKQKASELWDHIKKVFSDICGWFDKNVIQPILSIVPDWLKNIFSGSTKASLTVTSNSASGGTGTGRNALGTSYWGGGETWVGEHGPEKVTLPKGAQVQDHQSSVNSNGRGISIAKLADMIVVREEADIDKIANALVLKLNETAANMT